MATWVNRWNDWIAPEAELPGVWQRRDGGFRNLSNNNKTAAVGVDASIWLEAWRKPSRARPS